MSLRSQRMFYIPLREHHLVPELSPKGNLKLQFEGLGFMVSVNTVLFSRYALNTHYICIHTHWVLFSLHFCYTKFLCKTTFWLVQDWTLSWQVGRKLKIILSPGFKWSGRWVTCQSFGKPEFPVSGLSGKHCVAKSSTEDGEFICYMWYL